MIRRISAMLLAVASLFGATVAMAAPAQAFGCTYNNVCLWSDADGNGYVRNDFNSRSSWSNIYYGGSSKPLYQGDGVADNVSSIDNWDPDTGVSVYYNSGYVGPCFMVMANGEVSNMGWVTLSYGGKKANDNMNSHKFSYDCVGNSFDF
ncbi:peptidase inhibitor family I36 protein [Streptomyces sp. NPDC056222]|uniref:peptidase inhibitor family I36 protein n=1 Tax=Streptomyces sp. NPDC056222 TaxID=3345749 RepID=UPI0035D71BF7